MMLIKPLAIAALFGLAAAGPAEDFMRSMDKAVGQERRLRNLEKKLLAKAVPLNKDNNRWLEDGGNNNNGTLDLRDYALKYVGCQNVKAFSDDLAEDEDAESVLGMNRFVMFRFCQADLCSNYNKYGCSYDFGEYVIEMDYYLQAMATYHYDKYEEYCSACVECMTPTADDDTVTFGNYTDDAVVEQNVTNGNETVWSAQRDCQYYDACYNYKEACKSYMSRSTQYEDFFACTEFEVGNNVGYLGPHCAKDGKTIQIGIFDDENCESYIGDVVDLEQFTGMEFDDYGLSFYDSGSCISCVSGVSSSVNFFLYHLTKLTNTARNNRRTILSTLMTRLETACMSSVRCFTNLAENAIDTTTLATSRKHMR